MAKRRPEGSKSKAERIRTKGNYYGTTIGDNFWTKYTNANWSERGVGELWLTKDKLCFRLYLTLKPIEIPIQTIFKITTGHGHAGKLSFSKILKIHWKKKDEVLVSGFQIISNVKDLIRWQQQLQKVLKK